MIEAFRDVIDLWPSPAEMARAIGVSPWAVRKWRQRGKIPAEYWVAVVAAANRRGIEGVTLDALAAAVAVHPVSEAAE